MSSWHYLCGFFCSAAIITKLHNNCSSAALAQALALEPNVTFHEIYKPDCIIWKRWFSCTGQNTKQMHTCFAEQNYNTEKTRCKNYLKGSTKLPLTNGKSKPWSILTSIHSTSGAYKFGKKMWDILRADPATRILNLHPTEALKLKITAMCWSTNKFYATISCYIPSLFLTIFLV